MRHWDIARYAYEQVPFYQELVDRMPKEWDDLPRIDKGMMLRGIRRNIAPEYLMDELNGKLERVLTSGSTGECLEVLWKKGQNIKSMMPLWRLRKKWYGVSPQDKRCYFFTTKIENGRIVDEVQDKNGLGFAKKNMTEERLVEIFTRIREFRPVWLLLQPSMAMLLIHIAEKFRLQPINNLRYIELTGERFAPEAKRRIQNFFRCPAASQYGCYETNSIAYECPCGNLHVMTENVFVEVLDEKGEAVWDREGDIFLTSLQNRVMPFVRYRVGDRGYLREGGCGCGNSAPVLELFAGRENDWIMQEDGSRSHSDLFCHVMDMVNLALEHTVDQYQIVQRDYSDFDIYLVLDVDGEREEVSSLFMQFIGEFGEGKEFHFHFRENLRPSEETGKLAWFVSEVQQESEV